MVDPKVGKTVEKRHLSQSHNLSSVVETVTNSKQTKIRNQNSQTLGRKVDRRKGGVMTEVGSGTRVLEVCKTLVARRGVEEHVSLPADELVSNKEEQADNRCIFGHVENCLDLFLNLGHEMHAVVLLCGNECSILLHVVGESVMSSMAVFLRVN